MASVTRRIRRSGNIIKVAQIEREKTLSAVKDERRARKLRYENGELPLCGGHENKQR